MEMSRRWLLLAGCVLTALICSPYSATAQVRVDVRIGPPPVYRFAAPPPVVVIPGTYVYIVPDIAAEVFFYSGYWYRPYGGHWFRGRSYNGPWAFWPDNRVPRPFFALPPDYRQIPPGYRRIPQGELRRNWAAWERGRYWDKDRGWHEGWHGKPEERRDHFEGRPDQRRGGDRGHEERHEERHD